MFITVEDLAYMLLLAFALIGFLCYIIARFMRWLGAGDHVVLPTIIGAGLSIIAAFSGSFVLALVVGIIGSIISNLLITHKIAPKVDEKIIMPLDDKIGGALENASAKSDERAYQKILHSPDKEERVKLMASRFVWTHNFRYIADIAVEQGYNEILQRIEAAGFKNRYPDMTIQPTIVPGQFVITLFVPRGSIGICLLQSDTEPPNGITEIWFGVNNGYDFTGLELKIKQLSEIRKQLSTMLDDLRGIVADVLKESNAVTHSATLVAVRSLQDI